MLCFTSNPFPAFISSGKVVYKKGDKHPERIFSTFVAMFIEEGTLYFTEGGMAHTLTAGQWFIQTPGIRHYGHQGCEMSTVFHFIHFMPLGEWHIESDHLTRKQTAYPVNLIDSGEGVRVPKLENELPMRGVYPLSNWRELFERLEQEQEAGRWAIGKQACFLELLERMVWLDTGRDTANVMVRKVIAYIQMHYAESLTVSGIASHFHFSPDYLTRQMKQVTGMTPSMFLIQYRMDKAKHLLVHTNYSIQQIGRETGYPDIAVFSRMFKRHAGLSPAQYRKDQWGTLSVGPKSPR